MKSVFDNVDFVYMTGPVQNSISEDEFSILIGRYKGMPGDDVSTCHSMSTFDGRFTVVLSYLPPEAFNRGIGLYACCGVSDMKKDNTPPGFRAGYLSLQIYTKEGDPVLKKILNTFDQMNLPKYKVYHTLIRDLLFIYFQLNDSVLETLTLKYCSGFEDYTCKYTGRPNGAAALVKYSEISHIENDPDIASLGYYIDNIRRSTPLFPLELFSK